MSHELPLDHIIWTYRLKEGQTIFTGTFKNFQVHVHFNCYEITENDERWAKEEIRFVIEEFSKDYGISFEISERDEAMLAEHNWLCR